MVLKSFWRSLTFSDVFWSLRQFRVFSCFWTLLKDSWTFRRIILHWRVISGVSMAIEKFLKVLKRSLTSWSVLFCSKTSPWVLSSFVRLQYVLSYSIKFCGCCEAIRGISWVWSGSETFVNVLRDCLMFYGILTWSKVLLLVLSCFETFQEVLFWAVHKVSWWFSGILLHPRGVLVYSEAFWGILVSSELF